MNQTYLKQDPAQQKKALRETIDRLTAPVHVTQNSYREHERVEGYYEFTDYRHLFKNDRLLKLETFYGRVQMGYDPNRRKAFLFANMKTNRYDTVSSRYQRSMKEYQQRPELRKNTENSAFVAERRGKSAALLEKTEDKPWSERTMAPYLHNRNMEVLSKTMPFFESASELAQRAGNQQQIRALQETVRVNAAQGKRQKNAELHERIRELSQANDLLWAVVYRKDRGKRGFLRKLNYAFDMEKHDMYQYYREQRARAMREAAEASETPEGTEEAAKENNGH